MKSACTPAVIAGRLLTGMAAGMSLYLAAVTLSRTSLPGWSILSACQEATTSRWAYTFGIPVSFIGCVLYTLTLLLSWSYVRRERSFAGLQGGMAVSTVLAGAVWFTALQIFALESFCLWCSLIHASAVTGAFLLWWNRRQNPVPDLDCTTDLRDAGSPLSNDRVFRFTSTGAALVAIGLLALGSLSGPLHRVTTGVLNDARGPESRAAMPPQILSGTRAHAGVETGQGNLSASLRGHEEAKFTPPLRPCLTILNPEVRLNGVNSEQPQEIAINVRNTGNAPLRIEWLALGHDCEVTALPADSIRAGQAAVIGVRITPPAEGGVFQRELKVHSSAPGEPGVVTVRGGPVPQVVGRN